MIYFLLFLVHQRRKKKQSEKYFAVREYSCLLSTRTGKKIVALATLSHQRPFNQRYVTSIVRWHRIAVVLSPPVGSVNIILTLLWIDLWSVFDVLQKREPIFFWHVSRRYPLKWMIVSRSID